MSKKNFEIVLNEHGYHEVMPKPDAAELQSFYKDKYFQSDLRYSHEYSEEEKAYIRGLAQRKYELLTSSGPFLATPGSTVLEVGVGEGWTLAGLQERGLAVTGIDFTDYACANHNPDVAKNVLQGHPDEVVDELVAKQERFNLLWLDNVLEHSADPGRLLSQLALLGGDDAHLVIEVPNDYSLIQTEARKRALIEENFWEAVPEHLSYFNPEGLVNLCRANAWHLVRAVADFPIDLFLLNERSNYVSDPTAGKAAHQARINFEAIISSAPIEKVLRFYEAMLDVGLGRQIVAVFRLNADG